MINIIACISKNRGLGYNGELLFHLPTDLKLFKLMTMHATVIMGRKTYDSLYTKPLPNRKNIVLSSLMTLSANANPALNGLPLTEDQQHGSLQHNHALGDPPETEVIYFGDMDQLDEYVDQHIEEDLWIIGGQSLYEHFIERADKIILTEVDAEPKADAFFPMFDCEDYAIIKLLEGVEDGLHFTVNIYQRLKPWLDEPEYNKEPIVNC